MTLAHMMWCRVKRFADAFGRATYWQRIMDKARVRYQTFEFDGTDIHVRTLRDKQQFEDNEQEAEHLGISSATWPLFGVVWESGEVLARMMHTFDVSGLRILEVGCGIGLASIVLSVRRSDITASDYHPSADRFLQLNAKLNDLPPIAFVRTDWADTNLELGEFDLIIGSDVLYEELHVELLSKFIERHAKPKCRVIFIDPGRGWRAPFSKRMTAMGYAHDAHEAITSQLCESYKGSVLSYSRT